MSQAVANLMTDDIANWRIASRGNFGHVENAAGAPGEKTGLSNQNTSFSGTLFLLVARGARQCGMRGKFLQERDK